jgi:hypothetical protein
MDPHTHLSKLSVLGTVIRRCWPRVVEATVIPALLFYGCLVVLGLGWAYLAAIAWSLSTVARRVVRRRPVPPIVVLGVVGITTRTVVAVASGSAFVYFVQPVLANVAMGGVFLVSVAVGRPLIGRLAHEFWELTPEVVARPAVRRLFRRLTLLWAGVNLAIATMTVALLLWLPLTTILAMKQLSGLAMTFGATFLTIALSLRTARREGLVGPVVAVARIPVTAS